MLLNFNLSGPIIGTIGSDYGFDTVRNLLATVKAKVGNPS